MQEAVGFIMLGIEAVEDIRNKKISIWILIVFFLLSVIHIVIYRDIPVKELMGGIGIGIMAVMVSVVFHKSIGLGDGITLLNLGILVGQTRLLEIMMVSLFFTMIWGVFYMAKGKNRNKTIAFVPFILIGFVLTEVL